MFSFWCSRERCQFLIAMNLNTIWTQKENKVSGFKRIILILIVKYKACRIHGCSAILVYHKITPGSNIYSYADRFRDTLLTFVKERLCCLLLYVKSCNAQILHKWTAVPTSLYWETSAELNYQSLKLALNFVPLRHVWRKLQKL